MDLQKFKLAVVGLGYVGLPLAVAFGNLRTVLGFDIDKKRISDLKKNIDCTLEVLPSELGQSDGLSFSSDEKMLALCNCFIITVPTPVDSNKNPDFGPLASASKLVGSHLKIGDIVIYESTVYPGATEDECVPILEEESGLKFNSDFFVGYSPERINPGDKSHKLKDIVKVTSGSTPEVANLVDELYQSIVDAGTHKASSIKVAEAAKVIENTQRDVNIALINELSIIFDKLNIDTEEVLLAAESKWNFLPFKPGLVGGHCIGVDPYYLTYKAQLLGYQPEIILAGRNLNDGMGKYVANKLIKTMVETNIPIERSKVLIMGLTFKENCPDMRNTRVFDIAEELNKHDMNIDAFDPWVKDLNDVNNNIINSVTEPELSAYDAIIVAVGHDEFKKMGASKIKSYGKNNHILFDLKYLFSKNESDLRF
jgi:UDP-N-acetyl-D-galactosamine dehydrogenase